VPSGATQAVLIAGKLHRLFWHRGSWIDGVKNRAEFGVDCRDLDQSPPAPHRPSKCPNNRGHGDFLDRCDFVVNWCARRRGVGSLQARLAPAGGCERFHVRYRRARDRRRPSESRADLWRQSPSRRCSGWVLSRKLLRRARIKSQPRVRRRSNRRGEGTVRMPWGEVLNLERLGGINRMSGGSPQLQKNAVWCDDHPQREGFHDFLIPSSDRRISTENCPVA
jgi:hypothetical protein